MQGNTVPYELHGSFREGRLRQIREGEIRFVGDEIQFHGAARRWLKDLARQSSKREGRKVSPSQVAEGLIAGIQAMVGVQADLTRALERIRRILTKMREGEKP